MHSVGSILTHPSAAVEAYIQSPTVSSFHIGNLTIHFYAIMILLGIIVAVWLTAKRWKALGGTFDQILDLTIISVPCGIVGARLYHVITTPDRYFGPDGNWVDIFKIWNGGLGIWGAVFLGALGAWAWCRHRHYPMALLADCLAPALLIAQAIGRWGNWFNQELHGSCTTLPWGLILNESALELPMENAGTCPITGPYHPTFLYEMIWNLIGAALLLGMTSFIRKRFKAGSAFAFYVMWYTLGRTWIELLRVDPAVWVLGLRINVWVSICVFVAAAVVFVILQRKGSTTKRLSALLTRVTAYEAKIETGKISHKEVSSQLESERKAQVDEEKVIRKQRHEALVAERQAYEDAKKRVLTRKHEQKAAHEAEEDEEKDD